MSEEEVSITEITLGQRRCKDDLTDLDWRGLRSSSGKDLVD